MKNKSSVKILILMLLVSVCGSSWTLTVRDAWARPASIGENGAAYFVIEDGTTAGDTLLNVNSEIASASEVHMTMMLDSSVMAMQMQDSVPLSAGSNVEFKPSGLHVMLVGMTQELKVGDTITLTLNFEKGGTVTSDVPVKE